MDDNAINKSILYGAKNAKEFKEKLKVWKNENKVYDLEQINECRCKQESEGSETIAVNQAV